jgi:hypothetical protein
MSDLRDDDQTQAGSVAKTSDAVSQTYNAAKDAAGEASSSLADEATSLLGQVKQQAVSILSDQKDGVADRIDTLAETVHRSGAQFEGKQDWIAGAIDRGAAEVRSLATALRENDLASLFRQVQSIARQQPALFIGASFAAGFAVARLGKLVASDISQDDLPTLAGGNDAQA